MMKAMTKNNGQTIFVWCGGYHTREVPKTAKFRWDPDNRQWWTDDWRRAIVLLQYADDRARHIIAEAEKSFNDNLSASMATDAEIDVPAPAGLSYLPYQKGGIDFVTKKFTDGKRSVLIGDEMGLGKTIQAIGYINIHKPSKVLIICPASLKINWKRECEKWLIPSKDVQVSNTTFRPGEVCIVNYDVLSKHMNNITSVKWDLIIADEAHYAKNPKAKRTKALRMILALAPSILLTGTPILNRPQEAYEMLCNLDPVAYPNNDHARWKFYYRFCDVNKTRYGTVVSGAKNLDELQLILRNYMVRRKKSEVLKDLPPKTRQLILLDPKSPELKAIVERMNEMIINMTKEEYESLVNNLTIPRAMFDEMAAMRHELGVAKVPQVIEFVDDLLDQNGKVVVFAHHKDVVDAMMTHWGSSAVKVVGGMTPEEKDRSVKGFMEHPDIRVFVGNIEAAGVGLTLTSSSTVVFAELPWRPSDVQQAEDRCHRIGQIGNVLVYHLVVDGTLDSKLASTIVEKQKNIDKMVDMSLEDISIAEKIRTEKAEKIAEIAEVAIQMDAEAEKRKEKGKKDKIQMISEAGITWTQIREDALLESLRYLDSMNGDRALIQNKIGYNKVDGDFGHSLALQSSLSGKQFLAAYKLIRKYRGQIGPLYDEIYGE